MVQYGVFSEHKSENFYAYRYMIPGSIMYILCIYIMYIHVYTNIASQKGINSFHIHIDHSLFQIEWQ